MLRKDTMRHLWVAWLPALCPAVALILGLLRVRTATASTQDILQALFYCNLLIVIPIVAFLAGIALFQQEEWPLVWTFPVSRTRVLFRKLGIGFGLTMAGAAVGLGLFAVSHIPEDLARGMAGSGFLIAASLLVDLFLLGVAAGLGATSILYGVVLILAAIFGGFLLAYGTGLWQRFSYLMAATSSLAVPILDGVLLWPLLLLAIGVLFFLRRQFQPLRNAAIAAALVAGAVLVVFAADAVLLGWAADTDSLTRMRDVHARMAGGQRLLVCGEATHPRLNRWMERLRLGSLSAGMNLALCDPATGRLRQLTRYEYPFWAEASSDGRYVLSGICGFYGRPAGELRAIDESGRTVFHREYSQASANRLPVGFPQVLWQPDSHRFYLLGRTELERIDLDTGARARFPLPGSAGAGALNFSRHQARILDGGIFLYFRFYGDDAYRVDRFLPDSRQWETLLAEDSPHSAPYPPDDGVDPAWFLWGRGVRSWHLDQAAFVFRRQRVYFTWTRGQLAHLTLDPAWLSPDLAGLPAGMNVSGFVEPAAAGLLIAGNHRLSLRDWADGHLVYEREFPFGEPDGFASGDTAFLTAPAGVDAKRSVTAAMFLDIPSGRLSEPTRYDRVNFGWVRDRQGPVGLFNLWDSAFWQCFYRVDLRSRTIRKIMEERNGEW